MKKLVIVLLLFVSFPAIAQQESPEKRIEALGENLPTVGKPIANYVNVVRVDNFLFLSGKGSRLPDGSRITGKVGQDLSVQEGYEAAKSVALQHLAVIKNEIGDLSKVKRVVKVFGMVNCPPDFTQHSTVMNGYSDFMVEVFGEKGKHARSAVGMASLPVNLAVEVEVIVEIED